MIIPFVNKKTRSTPTHLLGIQIHDHLIIGAKGRHILMALDSREGES